MMTNGNLVLVEHNGEKYFIARCYTTDLNYNLRRLNKDEFGENIEDKNIIETYCVLCKDELGHYYVDERCNKSNTSMETAINDFMKHIF